MDIRKPVAVILIILMAFAWYFATQYKGKEDLVPASSRSVRHFNVELITIDKTDQHWDYVNQGAADMADMVGIQYKWEAPQRKNVQRQIELINEAVAGGANLIMVAASDQVAISSAIEDAKAQGVKVIYVDSPANEEAIITLATDNYSAGAMAGRTMIEYLEENGIHSGSIGIIGVDQETNSTMNRENGFLEVLNRDGRFTVLPAVYKNGDIEASQIAATEFILQNDELVGLFGTNEGSTTGVGMAIRSSGKNIIGIGFDRSDAILELINDGSLQAVMVQNPYTMGYLGMAEAIAALRGADTGPDYINTGVAILRKR